MLFAKKLAEWVAAAPPEERASRVKAAGFIEEARVRGQSKLRLRSLDLTSLPDCLAELRHLKELNVGRNQLTDLPALPASLTGLLISKNKFSQMPDLPPRLDRLKAEGNQLTEIGILPPGLRDLDVGGNQLTKIGQLPEGLVVLELARNQITSLSHLPAALHTADLCQNQLESLPALPARLCVLAVAVNRLSAIPALPNTLDQLWMGDNPNAALPELPASVNVLEADMPCIESKVAQWQSTLDSLTAALAAPPAPPAPLAQPAAGNVASGSTPAKIAGDFALLPDELIQRIAAHFVPGSPDAVSLSVAHPSMNPILANRIEADRRIAAPTLIPELQRKIAQVRDSYTNAMVGAKIYPVPAHALR